MSNATKLRKTGEPATPADRRRKLDAAAEALLRRPPRGRSANEIAVSLGLKPIKGRSGPKLAY